MPLPWFKFSRRYLMSPFFGDPKYDVIYIWLAANVTQFEYSKLVRNREVVLRPGQIVIGRDKAATSLGLSVKVYRDRIKNLEKGQLLDRNKANDVTLITLIDPDTYEWQRGVYSQKRASKSGKKGPAKGQQRARLIDNKDLNSICACAYGDEEDRELSDEESKRFEASFSPTKGFVLDVWKRERERYGLRYIKSPRNFRMADSVAAMIDDDEWTREDWEKAVRNFMADDWAREHGGISAIYEEFERWVSVEGKGNGNVIGNDSKSAGARRAQRPRAGKYSHLDAANFG